MKKHHIYLQIIAFVFACTIMQGCQKEDEQEGRVTLNAVLDDDYAASANGKAHIRGNKVYWDDNDLVNINGSIYKIKVSGESTQSARIDTVRYSSDGYAAVYPAGQVTGALSAGSPSVTVRIPSILYMTPGQTQNVKGLMVAKMDGDGTSLVFHNAGAVLDLSVKNGFSSENDLKLYRIVVSSSAHGLSGDGTLTIDGTAPTYSLSSAAGTPLTLDMENDAIAYNATKSYYIPIPSYTEDGGTQFSVTIYATCGDDHYVFSRSSNDGLKVARNKRVPVDVTLDADPSGYTTTTIVGNEGLMGSGTDADPYVIATLTDLNYFKSQVNGGNTYSGKYIRQTADIDASVSNTVDWTRIGTSSSNCFQGTYDGGGHTTTLKMVPTTTSYGFFGFIKNASINNLTIDGSCSSNTYGKVGGVCGDASNGTNYFYNCTNKIDVNGNESIGGIAGQMGAGIVDGCLNTGNLTSKKTGDAPVGGIVGFVTGQKIIISNCANHGNISNATGNAKIAAGILGKLYSPVSGSCITNCYSLGTIRGGTYPAGIVWCNPYNSTYKVTVSNCYFNGTLSAINSTTTYRAAILYYHNNGSNCTVSNCYTNDDCNNTSTNCKNGSTTFSASTGSLAAPQTINTVSCSTLYDALHNWQLLNTTYSDWKKETIPHLAWEN